jgi:AbrB family looped-hinge helix DNA binding protein
MSHSGDAAMPMVKIKEKGQVTLPAKIRERRGLHTGDYMEVQEEGNRIVLIPQEIAPRHPEIDKAIAEGLSDVRSGRVTPAFKNMAQYRVWRKTPAGKKFAGS